MHFYLFGTENGSSVTSSVSITWMGNHLGPWCSSPKRSFWESVPQFSKSLVFLAFLLTDRDKFRAIRAAVSSVLATNTKVHILEAHQWMNEWMIIFFIFYLPNYLIFAIFKLLFRPFFSISSRGAGHPISLMYSKTRLTHTPCIQYLKYFYSN